jgi:hypothetical protein
MMIELLRWSPMMKTYKNRDILSAAIIGQQIDVVKYLVELSYKGKTLSEDAILQRKLVNHRDEEQNNFLHFTYEVNNPTINELVLGSHLIQPGTH